MTSSHRGFQVRQHQPWKLWLALVLIVALLGLFFLLGRGYQSYELESLRIEHETLLSRIEDLELRNSSLVQKNAHLEGGSKIERDAYELANQELARLQHQLLALFFYLGRSYQNYELRHLQLERETLVSRIEELESRNSNLVQKNAHLEGSSKIERDAYELASQELVKLQQQLLAQKEELVFYRGIVSPQGAALAVNLQSFELRPKGVANQFSYKMILTKSGKSTTKVRGGANVLIRGDNSGEVKELKMTDLRLENPGKANKFAFRYFQVFEGDITLPEGFEPFEVEIGIKPTTKKVKSFSETRSWTQVLSEGV